jgi:hypothetical protein
MVPFQAPPAKVVVEPITVAVTGPRELAVVEFLVQEEKVVEARPTAIITFRNTFFIFICFLNDGEKLIIAYT